MPQMQINYKTTIIIGCQFNKKTRTLLYL